MRTTRLICFALICFLHLYDEANALEPIPDKLVVLTFDDSVRSQFTVVRPVLLDYGFGATFFITEGFDFKTNKQDYMTWEQIAQLHEDGFEIGNHSRDHLGLNEKTLPEYEEQLEAINRQCAAHGIPRPTSFAYPGNQFHPDGFDLLRKAGITFARRGGSPEYPYEEGRGFAYEPGRDHPLLLPSAGDARPKWTMADLHRAVHQARDGRIAILQFHGVPDVQHPWVHTPEDQFRAFMKYLSLNDYQVIALRDLQKYVDPTVLPASYETIIEERKQSLAEAEAD